MLQQLMPRPTAPPPPPVQQMQQPAPLQIYRDPGNTLHQQDNGYQQLFDYAEDGNTVEFTQTIKLNSQKSVGFFEGLLKLIVCVTGLAMFGLFGLFAIYILTNGPM